MDAPDEFRPLIDDIFLEKVRRARAAKTPGVLTFEGFDLFEQALERIRDGIRGEIPNASEAEVEEEVRRRLEIRRRIDEQGIYKPVP